MTKKLNIEEFWFFYNTTCWRIQRCGLIDYYFYVPTGRYIFKTIFGTWKGTKKPRISYCDSMKLKIFKDEDQAVRWLAKI